MRFTLAILAAAATAIELQLPLAANNYQGQATEANVLSATTELTEEQLREDYNRIEKQIAIVKDYLKVSDPSDVYWNLYSCRYFAGGPELKDKVIWVD